MVPAVMAGSHVVLGAAAWLVAAPHLGQPDVAPLPLGLAVLGALAPDIDHPKSWIGKRLRPVSIMLAGILGHRGLSHSLFAVVGCGWLLLRSGWPAQVVAPLVVGYLSHLAADLLTPGGLRLAWPFKGTWSLPLCRTGSPFEPMVVAVVLCCAWSGVDGNAKVRAGLRDLGACGGSGSGITIPALCPAAVPPVAKLAETSRSTPDRAPRLAR
jgi:inner membrane protein